MRRAGPNSEGAWLGRLSDRGGSGPNGVEACGGVWSQGKKGVFLYLFQKDFERINSIKFQIKTETRGKSHMHLDEICGAPKLYCTLFEEMNES